MSSEQCPRCRGDWGKKAKRGKIDWIQCDICSLWFHSLCVELSSSDQSRIASYHCPDCEPEHGPSHMKRQSKRSRVKIDYVALNSGETFAVDKSMHPHVPNFLAWSSQSSLSGLIRLKSAELTKQHSIACDLPVLIPDVTIESGLELPVPREKITVDYVTEQTGAGEPVEVMDVLSQQSESPGWSLGQWRDYFYTSPSERDRIRNVISLEISQVKGLGKKIHRPQMVRDLDLVDKVWCDTDGCEQPRPQVTKYCLMSVAGSYTDFHIDFSGTPVYYTVCHGTKTFLMFPPSQTNLQLYESWCHEPQQNFTWFPAYGKRINGKMTKPSEGIKVDLEKGALFIIPSGWIHSVYTPDDAVIIGGNFLTLKDLRMHLRIYNLEKHTRVPSKYRFPMFNKVLWLASYYYLNHREEFAADIGIEVEEGKSHVKKEDGSENINEGKGENEDQRKIGEKKNGESKDHVKAETPDESVHGVARARLILHDLISHLKEHYEMSKTHAVAKKSIPYKLIGRNIPEYFAQLEKWMASY